MEGNKRNLRRNISDEATKCANCFACKKDTELCPLNENYSPYAYLKWEAEYLKRRSEIRGKE